MILESFLSKIKTMDVGIHKAYNGLEALEVFKTLNCERTSDCLDVVILDSEMPIMSGIESCKQMVNLISSQNYK